MRSFQALSLERNTMPVVVIQEPKVVTAGTQGPRKPINTIIMLRDLTTDFKLTKSSAAKRQNKSTQTFTTRIFDRVRMGATSTTLLTRTRGISKDKNGQVQVPWCLSISLSASSRQMLSSAWFSGAVKTSILQRKIRVSIARLKRWACRSIATFVKFRITPPTQDLRIKRKQLFAIQMLSSLHHILRTLPEKYYSQRTNQELASSPNARAETCLRLSTH